MRLLKCIGRWGAHQTQQVVAGPLLAAQKLGFTVRGSHLLQQVLQLSYVCLGLFFFAMQAPRVHSFYCLYQGRYLPFDKLIRVVLPGGVTLLEVSYVCLAGHLMSALGSMLFATQPPRAQSLYWCVSGLRLVLVR